MHICHYEKMLPLDHLEVLHSLSLELTELRVLLPVIVSLRNPGLRERHWPGHPGREPNRLNLFEGGTPLEDPGHLGNCFERDGDRRRATQAALGTVSQRLAADVGGWRCEDVTWLVLTSRKLFESMKRQQIVALPELGVAF
eukprot:Skav217662  [mRNA]  locus=scaffold2919:146043:150270:+ [translate_table: standard]